jgi:hypothetical protein
MTFLAQVEVAPIGSPFRYPFLFRRPFHPTSANLSKPGIERGDRHAKRCRNHFCRLASPH